MFSDSVKACKSPGAKYLYYYKRYEAEFFVIVNSQQELKILIFKARINKLKTFIFVFENHPLKIFSFK